MATIADAAVDKPFAAPPEGVGLTAFVDRWIWVFMAALFVVTVLIGFIPDSLEKIAAVQTGARPPFPPILHVHAVLMGSWMLLLLTQATLMATGRSAWHKQLGMLSFGLAPAMVIAGIILIPTMYRLTWADTHAAHDLPILAGLPLPLFFVTNILLFQIRVAVLFPICLVIALWARKHDTGLHKRMMFLATVLPLPAAIDRIEWLPTSLPANPAALWIYSLLIIAPMFMWDLYRLRRIHRAYIIWLALFIPTTVAIQMLWSSPWWFDAVPRLMGVI